MMAEVGKELEGKKCGGGLENTIYMFEILNQ